jgi:hypothetical protein
MSVTSRLKPLAVTSSLGNWTGFANVTESGAGNATATSTFANAFLGTYDFSELPEGALITGIDVSIRYLNLTENGSTTITTNLYKGNTSSPDAKSPTSYTFVADESNESTQNYGGDGDLWGYENVTKDDISDLWIGLTWNNNTDNDTIAINGSTTTRPTVRVFYQSPRWAKIHTSGSPLSVTSITASGIPNNGNVAGRPIFVTPDGHFEKTSSIQRRSISGVDPYAQFVTNGTGLATTLDFNYTSYSINVPNLPISCSFITNSIRSAPGLQIVSSAMLFTDLTGGLEYSSSFFIEPVLTYEGSQSATANNQMQVVIDHGDVDDGDPVITASLPYVIGATAGALTNEIGTFNDRLASPPIFGTQSFNNYIRWNSFGGRYIKILRTPPVGLTVTASFSIPFFFETNNSFNTNAVSVTLRQFIDGNDYDDNSYFDVKTLNFSAADLAGENTNFPFSGSITGSIILNDSLSYISSNEPIFRQDQRYTLVVGAVATTKFSVGYPTSSGGDGTAQGTGLDFFKFQIESQSQGVLDSSLILGASLSSSYEGAQFGGYSGSLSGVTLNSTPISKAVYAGNGISFKWGSVTTDFWRGARSITASIILYNRGEALTGDNKSGLRFLYGFVNPPPPFEENPLLLTNSLAGDGLDYANGGIDIAKMGIAGNDGNSGLFVEEDGIKLHPNFPGSGISFTSGQLKTSLFSSWGLEIADNKLRLTSSLAGDGLVWDTSNGIGRYSTLLLDTTKVVDPSSSLRMQAPGFTSGLSVGTSALSAPGQILNLSYTSSEAAFYNYITSFHSTLAGFEGNLTTSTSIAINNSISADKAQFHTGSFLFASSASTAVGDNNFLPTNGNTPSITPSKLKRGGILVTTGNSIASGALGWFDSSIDSNGNAQSVTFDNRTLTSGSWLLSTASFYSKRYSSIKFSPWAANEGGTATASIDSSSDVGIVSTIITGTDLPQNLNEHEVFYSSRSISNYGAWYIRTGVVTFDSNVYVYITD